MMFRLSQSLIQEALHRLVATGGWLSTVVPSQGIQCQVHLRDSVGSDGPPAYQLRGFGIRGLKVP